MSFTHLQVYSDYSMRNGIVTFEELFRRARQLGMRAVAITDSGTVGGLPKFLEAASRYPDIKPIAGCEYCLSDSIYGRRQRVCGSVTLLAKNLEGFKNLCRLYSASERDPRMIDPPEVSHADLARYSEGLVCLFSGDLTRKGHLPANIDKVITWYRRVFGDDCYLKVSRFREKSMRLSDDNLNQECFAAAARWRVRTVATNHVTHILREDLTAQQIHAAEVREAKGGLYDIPYMESTYLKSGREMEDMFRDHIESVLVTEEIAAGIERYSICYPLEMPVVRLPEGVPSASVYLSGLLADEPDQDALGSELKLIRREGLTDYFLMQHEVVDFARTRYPVESCTVAGPYRLTARSLGLSSGPGDCGAPAGTGRVPDMQIRMGGDVGWVIGYLRDRYGADNVVHVTGYERKDPAEILTSLYDHDKATEKDICMISALSDLLGYGSVSDFFVDDIDVSSIDLLGDELKNLIHTVNVLSRCIMGVKIDKYNVAVCPDMVKEGIPVMPYTLKSGEKILTTPFDRAAMMAHDAAMVLFDTTDTLDIVAMAMDVVEDKTGTRPDPGSCCRGLSEVEMLEWMKTHYPLETMVCILERSGEEDEVAAAISQCRLMGIRVIAPDINTTGLQTGFSRAMVIKPGLKAACGLQLALHIMKEREDNGPFCDISDLFERMGGDLCMDKLERMIRLHCLDEFKQETGQIVPAKGERYIS